MENIKGKVVAITGASSGIGEGIARHLANLGAKVVLGARREEKLKQISDEIIIDGGEVEYFKLDVTVPKEVKAFTDFAVSKFGQLDVIVNNAGLMPLSMINNYKIDEWHRMIDVNIKGVLHGIAAALPIFESKDRWQLINITSV